jgi:hypothetical protein
MEFLPHPPSVSRQRNAGSARQRIVHGASLRNSPTSRGSLAWASRLHSWCNQLLIPAGTQVNGIIGTVAPARRFSLVRGQSYVNLTFRTLEIDSRLIPVQMSILTLEQPRSGGSQKTRRDVKVVEGQVVEEKHDYQGDVIGATLGTGGGTLIGAVFSHLVRGFGIGLAGSAAYIVARKGKEVEIPVQSSMLVRIDNTVTVPGVTATDAAYNASR